MLTGRGERRAKALVGRLLGARCVLPGVGMGSWHFVYYPTRADPGAASTGLWLTEMNEIPCTGVPWEPSQSWEPLVGI